MNRAIMIRGLIIIILSLFFLPNFLFSQSEFTGRVFDKNNKEPLAFVNIVYNSRNWGTTSDLNGRFQIPNRNNIEFLKISYLGYKSKKIELSEIKNRNHIEIFLESDAYRLDEVVVLPGENPAHRIIKEVKRNADKNNPEKMASFSYIEYSKLIFTIDVDDIDIEKDTVNDSISMQADQKHANDTIKKDTVRSQLQSMKDFFDYQHLFITEAITERRFRQPDNNKQEVLAHRMSGLQNPAFTMLTSQLQSFSFYDDFISIMDNRYVNPLSRGSTRRYFFLIEDTMYNEKADTIFIISFRPGRGRNFDGLKGVLHINSNNYAVQNVRARPFDPGGSFDIIIQQKYELIDEQQWFPVQLNTEIIFNFLSLTGEGGPSTPLVGIGTSYLRDINLNPEFGRRDFNHVRLSVDNNAHKKDEYFWALFRADSLSMRDLNTYRVIDSIGEEANLDRYMELIEFLATGYIPYRFLSFDPNKFMYYNEYEGYRMGLGAKTNRRLLPWFSIGGYFAYGFRDEAWKYGAETEFIFHKPSNTRLRMGYKQDLKYSDFYSFNRRTNVFSTQTLRHFFYSELDSITEYYAGLRFNTLRYLSADVVFSHSENNIINRNRYNYNIQNINYLNTKLKVSLRFAFKERFLETPRGNRLSLGTNWPIFYFNFTQGLDILGGEHIYQKYEAQVNKRINTLWIGDSEITVTGGLASGDVPYSDFYYGEGTKSFLSVNNTFNTMKPHEFISDRFVSAHFIHNFKSLLFRTENWRPEIAITTSAAWGENSLIKQSALRPHAQSMDKGYFESGIQFNNLIPFGFSGYGLGVYYRYGPYSFSKEINNFAFNMTFILVL